MADRYRPRRSASERFSHGRWQFQERASSFRSAQSNDDEDVQGNRATFGIRHPSIRSTLSLGRRTPELALHAEGTTSTQTTDPSQQQFVNGKPTASLNGQRPGYVRTFSQSSSLNGYNAETTPNMAYIQRSASIASNSPPGSVRYEAATPPINYTEVEKSSRVAATLGRGAVHGTPVNAIPNNERKQQLGIAQVLASDSRSIAPRRAEDRPLVRHGSERIMTRSGARRRVQVHEPSQEYLTRSMSMRVRIDEVDEEKGKRGHNTPSRDVHGTVTFKNDFFGDSIPEEEPSPSLRTLSQQSLAQRQTTPEMQNSRAAKLFALNPDPPSHSGSASGSIDDLAAVRRAQELSQTHPSYRLQQPIQPATPLYPQPTPLRQHIFSRDEHGAKITPEHSFAPFKPRRLTHHLTNSQHWCSKPSVPPETDEASLTKSSPYWVLMFLHILLWSAIITFFIWRIMKLESTIPFQCYELQAHLLSLAQNGTLPIAGNSTRSSASLYDDEHDDKFKSTPSSITIPDEYQAAVRAQCVLTPVNQAVVLASGLDVLFMMALLACGLADLLHKLLRHQVERLVGRNAACTVVVVVVKVYARVVAAGIAGVTVVFAAWSMRHGRF